MAILGIDEVGRGPLAGPLVVGAVILPEEWQDWYDELNDSKQLSKRKREELNELILDEATTGLGWVSAREIDEMGMTEALKLATRRAVKKIQETDVPFSEIIIDGNMNFLEETALGRYATTMVKGDALIKEISAASIIAKVARDNYMADIAEEYPVYGFERHVGYGTDLHREMISRYGLCPEHRRLVKLIRKFAEQEGEDLSWVWSGKEKKNTTATGQKAETVVAKYLEGRRQIIVRRNFKTKYCEIDIISLDVAAKKIYFTEVKYRKDARHGGGKAAVDRGKLEQMKFAAEVYLKLHPGFSPYDPLLAVAEVAGEDFVIQEWFTLPS